MTKKISEFSYPLPGRAGVRLNLMPGIHYKVEVDGNLVGLYYSTRQSVQKFRSGPGAKELRIECDDPQDPCPLIIKRQEGEPIDDRPLPTVVPKNNPMARIRQQVAQQMGSLREAFLEGQATGYEVDEDDDRLEEEIAADDLADRRARAAAKRSRDRQERLRRDDADDGSAGPGDGEPDNTSAKSKSKDTGTPTVEGDTSAKE